MLKTAILLSTFFVFSSTAFAEPIYLECMGSKGAEKEEFFVRLNEESEKIRHDYNDGLYDYAEGIFSANNIIYRVTYYRYHINRTTLVFKKFPLENSGALILEGSCSVVKVANRKI